MADPKRVVERHLETNAFPDVVAAEGRFIGTHTGVMRTPAGDVAATGRPVDLRWMSSYQVRGDELASEHLYFGQAELLGELGLMPAGLLAARSAAAAGSSQAAHPGRWGRGCTVRFGRFSLAF
jgi:hypothetical protein